MQNQRLEKLLTFNKRKNFLKSCGIEHFHIVKEDAYRYFFEETSLPGRCVYNFYRGDFFYYRGELKIMPNEEDEAVDFFINYCSDYFDYPAMISVPTGYYSFYLYVNKTDKNTVSTLIKKSNERDNRKGDYIFISSDGTYITFKVFEEWISVTKSYNQNLNFSTAVMAEFLAAEDD